MNFTARPCGAGQGEWNMSMLLKRLAAPLLMLAWAVYYFLQVSRQNPQSQYLIRPVFYVICVIFAVIAAGEISRLRKEQKSAGGVGAPAIPISDQVRALLKNKVALFMLTTLIYLLVMQLLGFILSTAFYLFFRFPRSQGEAGYLGYSVRWPFAGRLLRL